MHLSSPVSASVEEVDRAPIYVTNAQMLDVCNMVQSAVFPDSQLSCAMGLPLY
jgi:hypothetical protein